MFTIKVFYSGDKKGTSSLYQYEQVNIGRHSEGISLSLFGPGERVQLLELRNGETVYVENAAGKTVDVVRPPEPL